MGFMCSIILILCSIVSSIKLLSAFLAFLFNGTFASIMLTLVFILNLIQNSFIKNLTKIHLIVFFTKMYYMTKCKLLRTNLCRTMLYKAIYYSFILQT